MHTETDPFDYFRISMLPSIGPARGRALLAQFRSFTKLLRASADDLCRVEGISTQLSARVLHALREERNSGEIERTVERNRHLCMQHGIRFLPLTHPDYPAILRSIYDPPLFLFVRGEMTVQDERAIAVVGTRSPSDYGRQVSE